MQFHHHFRSLFVLLLTAFTLTSLGLTSVSPALARDNYPVCQGSNMIEELQVLEPKRYEKLQRLAKAEANDNGILWRITGEDEKVSYLFGTFHSTDPRITKLNTDTKAALTDAQTVAVEVSNLSPKTMQSYMQQNPGVFFSIKGPKLNEYLSQEDYEAVSKVAIRQGMPKHMIPLLKPWFANISYFQVPACEAFRMGKGLSALDQQIIQQAKDSGKRLVGLETIHDQFSAFDAIPLRHQVTLLQDGIHNLPRINDFYITAIALYHKRELGMLIPLSIAYGRDQIKTAAAFVEFLDIMVVKRNKQMFENSLPLVNKGGAFIAVGALHLIGRDGLVAAYRQAGFNVEKVN